ncbi:MAG: DUF1566 domain-containing protein [Desulfococcaceae bacterium]
MNDPVIRTDQTRCYDAEGGEIDCPGSGQDGETRPGAAGPEPRFAVEDDAVRDRLTGLIWSRDANPGEFPMSWPEGLEFIAELNRDRFLAESDWRPPNRRELFSLASHVQINPSLPEGHPFENVFPGYCWTSTTVARLPEQAWYVHLGGARLFKGMKHGSYMVWPVRGGDGGKIRLPRTGQRRCFNPKGATDCAGIGQDGEVQAGLPWPEPRMATDGEIVNDRLTGRVWTRNADLTGGPVSWSDALARVAALNRENAHGFSDWRLPSIRELESLTDMDAHSPAIAGADNFENIRDFYWSATTSVYDPTYAWTFYSRDGIIGVGFKAKTEFGVWAVRGGG